MQTKSGEWWDYSWNVAPGCTKVSPECDNCWALAMAKRLQGMKKFGYQHLVDAHGQWTGRINLLDERLEDPLHLTKPLVIAVNLMGDLFHPNIPFGWQKVAFGTMYTAEWHIFMVLTKRPEIAVDFLKYVEPMQNVFIGTTTGTQKSADKRWSSMALLAQQGWNTWVSSEPRLEAIDWNGWSFLKLMVTGGESGPYARPMSPAWPRADAQWCLAHGVKFHFKEWGEWGPDEAYDDDPNNYSMTMLGNEVMVRWGRRKAGRALDGCIWNEEIGGEE